MMSHFGVVQPLLTDFYQITMAYAYWKSGKADEPAVFEVFFRKNPFQGEFTIFAGLSDCIEYLKSFKVKSEDVEYLRKVMPPCTETKFFDYLPTLNTATFSLWSVVEGSTVFPREPIMRVEGPVLICQLLETTLLNLINYASLIATNAARFRLAAGPDKRLFEFGLRRAQGPDGGLSASRYAFLGGYDGTSNVLAGKMFDIPVVGTHAHSFVSSFQKMHELNGPNNQGVSHLSSNGSTDDEDVLHTYPSDSMTFDQFMARCVHWSNRLCSLFQHVCDQAHSGELAAFVHYAFAFPTHFVGLVDTYDVLRSGIPNFCAVGMALHEYGYQAVGVRIDSGDLAFLSLMVRQSFKKVATTYNLPWFENISILVSNDLNEDTMYSMNQQGHSIDAFCVGTNLVTCQKQPALGCVYKLVEISGNPTMKLSAVVDKVTLPGRKTVYRLFGKSGDALLDIIQRTGETPPQPNQRILCRHPSEASKRVFVVPDRVEETLKLFWDHGELVKPLQSLNESRERVKQELAVLRSDYKRQLNPTPYKVSLSEDLYDFTQDLWLQMTPIAELR